LLGRDISKDEAREFTHIVRRIAALLLLEPELDKNYLATKINSYLYKVAFSRTARQIDTPLRRPTTLYPHSSVRSRPLDTCRLTLIYL